MEVISAVDIVTLLSPKVISLDPFENIFTVLGLEVSAVVCVTVLLVTVVLVKVVTVDPLESKVVVVLSEYDVVITGSLSEISVLTISVVVVVSIKLARMVVEITSLLEGLTVTIFSVVAAVVAVPYTISVSLLS